MYCYMINLSILLWYILYESNVCRWSYSLAIFSDALSPTPFLSPYSAGWKAHKSMDGIPKGCVHIKCFIWTDLGSKSNSIIYNNNNDEKKKKKRKMNITYSCKIITATSITTTAAATNIIKYNYIIDCINSYNNSSYLITEMWRIIGKQ